MKVIHLFSKFLIVVMTMTGFAMQSIQAADNKTIVVYGASGRIGEVIVEVALERGYKVIGISRNPDKLQVEHKNFTAKKGDLMDVISIRELARGVDAIVISVLAKARDNQPENSLVAHAAKNMQEALGNLENKPYIVQIGSASLMYGSTLDDIRKNMKDAPFPFEEGTVMYGVLFGHQLSFRTYLASNLPWTIVAPPMKILGIYENPDKTTTKETFRTSTSEPLIDTDGNNTIYVRDLARAAVSEIEDRKFERQVFTVGY
ncbi:MAG: NAD(P)H-binding protein [Gammaproteobacteria bacterium]|nr:NAD(P)H-binding protein [Gammaproteobacteria bacterium]